MKTAINNIEDLRLEISGLRKLESEQQATIALHFNGPAAIFTTVKSLFSPSAEKRSAGDFSPPDLLQFLARFAIPFTLNKFIFRRSNFLVKALAGLIGQKAAGLVTEKSAVGLLVKVKSLFNSWFPSETKDQRVQLS